MGGHGHSHDGGHGHSHAGGHGHSHDHGEDSGSKKNKKKSTGHGHSHAHGHSHGGDGHETKFLGCCYLSNKIRISIMLSMTFFFFLIELIAGQITKSTALVTDSFHMLSDSLALIIGLVSIIMSSKKSAKNTFGWVRAEVLGALVNSVFLVSLCLGMVIEVVERLIETEEIKEPKFLLLVGCIGLLINLIGLFVFGHSHSHNLPNVAEEDDDDDSSVGENQEAIKLMLAKENAASSLSNGQHDEPMAVIVEPSRNSEIKQKKSDSEKKKKPTKCHILSKEANMNMRAVFLHVLADALGSVIVIISALLNVFQEKLNIHKNIIIYIDPVLTLLLICLILLSAIPLLKDSALILLQTVPKEIEIKKLKQDIVKKIPGILSVHELHVWKLSGNKIIATAHVTCHNSHEYMKIATDLKAFFHKRGIHSTTFQPEFTDPVDGVDNNCILECNKDCNSNTCCGQTNAMNSTPSNGANNNNNNNNDLASNSV